MPCITDLQPLYSVTLDPRDVADPLVTLAGSAPDITGQGIANPIGTIWSAAMMLDWLGEKAASKRLDGAFRKAIQEGKTSGDLGGQLDTDGVARAVMERL